jgi:transposase
MKIRQIPFERLVFLDESGLNLSMSRSHAWVKRGTEFIDRVPMNWGKNLNLLGAIRRDGWVVLTTTYEKATKDHFVWWVKTKLLPKLRVGDVLVMDNLAAHHDPRVVEVCAQRGVEVLYLPPYSPDFNPIEMAFSKLKALLRKAAARTVDNLWSVVADCLSAFTSEECRHYFEAAGYDPD